MDKHSEKPLGVFQVAVNLLKSDTLSLSDSNQLNSKLTWFDQNLKKPLRFNKTKSKGWYRKNPKGISWFKERAQDHLDKANNMISIIEQYGYFIKNKALD